MRHLLHPALLLGLSSLAAAVFKDEVGHVDFHYPLVGLPQPDTTFFHRPLLDDKASLLYTLSDVGVIGAVNPSTGDILWRQRVSDELTNGGGHLRALEGQNWVAAAYGSKVQAWNALTGRSIWDAEFDGNVADLEIMEMQEGSSKDVLVLSKEKNGATVLRRLNADTGSVVWEFRVKSKDIPLQVATSISSIYVVGLHGSPSSYTVKVTSLDAATGTRVDDWSIGTKGEVHKPEDVMFVGTNSVAPFLAWTSASSKKLSINILGTRSKQEFSLPPDFESVHIHAPHLVQSQPHFLVHIRSPTGNRAEVFHTDLKTNQVKSAFELAFLPGKGAFSTSSDEANVYFTRIHRDEVVVISSESSNPVAYWRLKDGDHVDAVQAVTEVIRKADGEGFAVRSALTTSYDDWIMIKNGEQDWLRPEGLSGSIAAVWADIPEEEGLAKALEQEAHTNPVSAYVHRVQRHLDDLQYLPDYLASIPSTIMASLSGKETVPPSGELQRDSFGFNKVIVGATMRGRLYGLDSGDHGKVLWSTQVFPQSRGEALDVRGMLADDDKGIVTLRGSKGEYASIRTVDGVVVEVQQAGSLPPVFATATIDGPHGKWLWPFGPDGQPSEGLPAVKSVNSTVVVHGGEGVLKGVRLEMEGGKPVEREIWQFQVLPGQRIAHVATLPRHNPIASIGRVLGDRRVSYKYLNPNTLVVSVIEEATSRLSVRLLDTVSGQILASQQYDGVDPDKSISCVMAENWYACSFFGDHDMGEGSTSAGFKGYQIVVSDLYESPSPNDRGPLGDATSFSALAPVDSYAGAPLPWVESQAWVVSQPLEKLSVTQTRQGITTKQLLAYLPESYSVLGLPRYLIDPRRPVGRDPTPAEIEAEGLPKYTPDIEVDPRSTFSHERVVMGIEGILATTSAVESTSLVVAYGIDVYGSRVMPSGTFDILDKGFDKVTLVGTVVALFAGVMFLAPMVLRKQIDMRWEAPM